MLVRPHFQRLVERARMRQAVRAAFVYPCDRDWLQLALSAAFAGFFEPVLVGPEARIRDAALQAGLDISRLPIANTADATSEAAACAIELARGGTVRVLVRGSIANEDLLGPIAAPDSGLRTDRRLSHACFLDLPGRTHGMLLTDSKLNLNPTLGAKKDMLRNAVDLAMAIGIAEPRVAILAGVGNLQAALPSTLDADTLKTMAAQGLFPGAVVDGPLTADVALAPEIARAQGVPLDVAGRPDVLVAPSMEAASLLLRSMIALTGGFAAGIVLGARLPVLLPTRFDSMEVRIASCVLAVLHATHERAAHAAAPARPAEAQPDRAPHATA